jgi:hypothetical protein
VRKDSAAGWAKPAFVLLQAGDDLIRDRYEIFAQAIDVGLASRLLFLRAWFGHRTRSRETKRRRYGNPRRIPHSLTPLMIGESPAGACTISAGPRRAYLIRAELRLAFSMSKGKPPRFSGLMEREHQINPPLIGID